MSTVEQDDLTPTEEEISEVLNLYGSWLQEEYNHHQDRDKAILEATVKAEKHEEVSKVFFWIVDNDYALIYDVDDTLEH